MKRWLLKLALFLLLGAIVNVAVALGCVVGDVQPGLTYGLAGGYMVVGQGRTVHVTTGYIDSAGLPLRALKGDNGDAAPLRPLWPGFAINTVFYALVLWAALRRAVGAAASATHQARPVPEVRLPRRHQQTLHRVRRDA